MPDSLILGHWKESVLRASGRIQGVHGNVSYAALDRKARAVASELVRALGGPLEGRRVAILVEPGADFISGFFGILLAGGTCVVLSPLHPDAESAYFCEDSCAGLILISRVWEARARRFASALPLRVIEEISESFLELPPTPDPSAPALQLYTSGTTGKPKGAVLTHGNLGHQQKLLMRAWALSSTDTLLHILPLHHMHGLCIALLSSLAAGASVRFVPEFNTAKIWERLREATVFMAVPTIYAKLFEAYDQAASADRLRWQAHARDLRLATSGSAALPVTLAQRWKDMTGTIPLERFGMTEVGVALSNPLHDERQAGSVGVPLPSVRTRIVNEAGEEALAGELWIAGPSVFSEYFEQPEATSDSFVQYEGTRYFRTGDRVERDRGGYLRVLGRASVDILKSGGYKLSALEIEEILRLHPAVGEVAVIGLPDPVWGDRAVACVVLRKGAIQPSGEELRSFAKTHLAAYKVPKEIHFLNELPRNAVGKVMKPELKKRLQP